MKLVSSTRSMTRTRANIVLLGLWVLLIAAPRISFAQTCTTTINAGTDIATAVANVASGGTVCLNAGGYSAFNSTVTKTSMTTVQPAPGVSQSQVTIPSVNVGTSQNLKFQNMTIGETAIGTGSAAALHIHFANIKFTGAVCINTPTNVNQDTLIDSSTFAGVGTGCTEGRVGVNGRNVYHSVSSGVVISNNIFGPGGCSDGIQIVGDALGVQILNNEFVGIKQGSCVAHSDPIQFYGAQGTIITGNYFHGNSTGIMSGDCNGSNSVVTNNVFVTDGEYPDQVVMSGSNAGTYDHNTFSNGARMRFGKINCQVATNVKLTNNMVSGGIWLSEGQTTSGFTISNNQGLGGSNAITGAPTYVGGSSPTTWAGWRLANGSAGKNAGTDGLDIGTLYYGPGTGGYVGAVVPAPTGLTVR
jgi:hypothetical protein